MTPVLRAENLDAGYDGRPLVRGVDIRALRGQTVCLIGPNGAGKSTILRTLAGLLAPVSGTVYLGGTDIHRLRPNDKARRMAVVLTDRLRMSMTTAAEVAAMGRLPYTGFIGRLSPEDSRIVAEALAAVGAADLSNRFYSSLSDGEKQKVLLARALAQQPELIILDEPTSHLDIKHKVELVRILSGLSRNQGLTVVLSLHDLDIAVKSCQTVLLIKNGLVVAQGKPEDVVARDTIGKLYDIEGAAYDSLTGGLEIRNEKAPEVFIAAGAGTGAPVYRMISRMGYGIATGILQENDIDFRVAASMGLTVVSEKSFEPIGRKAAAVARIILEKSRFLIDCGFPLGNLNRVNLRLLRAAARGGIPLFSMRNGEDLRRIYGGERNVIPAFSASDLSGKILARDSGTRAGT